MLPAAHRLTRSTDFAQTVRRSPRTARCAGQVLVVHVAAAAMAADAVGTPPPRVGFVVSRAVGGAVARNRTKRRLRHLMAERVGELPAGTRVVVRALPAAVSASGTELSHALDRCLRSALARASRA
jgi:ribonuclease P protein component